MSVVEPTSVHEVTVSIVMAAFNAADTIKDAVDSVLAQTMSDWELIVVDDGSTDNTAAILGAYTDRRIRVIRQDNHGLTRSLNHCLSLARGKYIARLDSDDICLPDRLRRQVEYLSDHPEVGLLGTYYYMVSAGAAKARSITPPVSDHALRRRLITRGTPLRHSTVMLPAHVFDVVGRYNENFRQGQDYELWVRVAANFQLATLPEYLCLVRMSKSSITGKRDIRAKIRLHNVIRRQAEQQLAGGKSSGISALLPWVWFALPKNITQKVIPTRLEPTLRRIFRLNPSHDEIPVAEIKSKLPFDISI